MSLQRRRPSPTMLGIGAIFVVLVVVLVLVLVGTSSKGPAAKDLGISTRRTREPRVNGDKRP